MTRGTLAAALLALCAACDGGSGDQREGGTVRAAPAGDAERGRLLLRQYACGACHRIPGVATADGNVGPPLVNVREQVYVAGVLPNTPANLVRFIRHPQQVDPLSMMPDLGVGEAHARDMVAYLMRP